MPSPQSIGICLLGVIASLRDCYSQGHAISLFQRQKLLNARAILKAGYRYVRARTIIQHDFHKPNFVLPPSVHLHAEPGSIEIWANQKEPASILAPRNQCPVSSFAIMVKFNMELSSILEEQRNKLPTQVPALFAGAFIHPGLLVLSCAVWMSRAEQYLTEFLCHFLTFFFHISCYQ